MSSGFEDLRAFLAVSEEGSFLSAAVKLGVSRTTLRRQVDALEAQTGVPLLQRGQAGVQLTEAGRRLLTSGRKMELEFSSLLHAVRETGKRPSGEVRLLLQIGLQPMTVVALYAQFRAAWPEVKIRARFTEVPVSANLSEVDVLVWMGFNDPGPPWETHAVLRLRQRLFADEAYLAARGTPRSLKELSEHDLLAWAPPGETELRLPLASGQTHPVRPTLIATNVHLIHECVGQGLGIGWAPDAGLPAGPDRPPYVPVLDDLVGGDTELRLAVPRALANVPKVRVLLDSIRAARELMKGPEPFLASERAG